MREPSCTNTIVPGTNIIKSEPYGSWTPEYTINNRENILKWQKISKDKNGVYGLNL